MSIATSGMGGSIAVGPTSGGKVYAYNNITTTASVVLQPNPQRTTASFHNPGSVNIQVAPVNVQGINVAPTTPTNIALALTTTALGGSWTVTPGASLIITGECSGAYQAVALLGSTNPLTVSESNV